MKYKHVDFGDCEHMIYSTQMNDRWNVRMCFETQDPLLSADATWRTRLWLHFGIRNELSFRLFCWSIIEGRENSDLIEQQEKSS